MRVVVASIPAHGHLYPMMPLALACAEAGHDTVIATGEPFLSQLPLPTVPSMRPGVTLQWAEQEAVRRHPQLQGYEVGMAMFADVTAGEVVTELVPQLQRLRPDVVVYETTNMGAGLAAAHCGVPAVTFGIGVWMPFYAGAHEAAIGYHPEVSLLRVPDGPLRLADLYLDPIPASLQAAAGAGVQAPGGVAPIRSIAWNQAPQPLPDWVLEKRTRPRVFVTLGTVSFGEVGVLRQAALEIADLAADVLVAVGPEGDPSALGDLPDAVHVERFVDQAALWPHVDAAVVHGGTGTMLGALAAGVPLLLRPQGADQFFNADALTTLGAGRALRNDECPPGAVGEAVAALLAAGPERQACARIRDEIAAMPAPRDVVPVLERLAARS